MGIKKQDRQKKAGGDAVVFLNIRLVAARSNPIIYRELSLPESCTVSDLFQVADIAFGGAFEEMQISIADKKAAEEDSIGSLFAQEDRCILHCAARDGIREGVELYADLLGRENGRERIPRITKAVGINIPAQVPNMSDVNYIHQGLDKGGSVLWDGVVYDGRSLNYSEKKAMNALHRKYAPELAQKEVNTRICIPMKQMLGMLKLDSLRQITDRFGVYLYSGKRKAEIIDSICHKFNREYLEKVMGVMSVEEFQYFSTYALDESPERRAPEISEKLKQLSARGLVQYEEARGYCVASEFMSIFEELYESGRETQYLHEKYMYTALLACRELYGLFDREMFCAVLGTFGDQGITEEEKTDYFKTFLSGFNSLDLAGLDEECCYYSRLLGKSEAVRIRKKMYPEKVYYLPDAEEIRDFTTKGLPVREADSKAYGVIFKKYTGYYSYRQDDSDEYLYSAIRRIHRGDTGEQVLAELMRPLYSLRWAKPAEKSVGEESLNKLIRQLELNTPLTELRGYSLKNCPKELKAHYEEQREKKATPPARNVKKAVAVKKNTRGKK